MSDVSENASPKSPLDQALELLLYAPVGLLSNADEVMNDLVRRGRQQVAVAKVFGELALKQGQKEARKLADRAQHEVVALIEQLVANGWPGGETASAPDAGSEPDQAPAVVVESGVVTDSTAAADRPDPAGPGEVEALAIPGYDSLSASQVVPRLASLSVEELEAVGRYERNGRRRKTILNRIAQLQAGA